MAKKHRTIVKLALAMITLVVAGCGSSLEAVSTFIPTYSYPYSIQLSTKHIEVKPVLTKCSDQNGNAVNPYYCSSLPQPASRFVCAGETALSSSCEISKYSATFTYPKNNLPVCAGKISVSATAVSTCSHGNGVTVDQAVCASKLPEAPQITQESPPGSRIGISIPTLKHGHLNAVCSTGQSISDVIATHAQGSPELDVICDDDSVKVGVKCSLKAVRVSAGGQHTCAVASDGRVYCSGLNSDGQLGDGTFINRLTPVAIDMTGALVGKTIKKLQSGTNHTCAIASDDKVYCWGQNKFGQLGDGTTTNRSVPVAVDVSGVLAGKVLSGIGIGDDYTCVYTASVNNMPGSDFCWGQNSNDINDINGLGVISLSTRTPIDLTMIADHASVISIDGVTKSHYVTINSNTAPFYPNRVMFWGTIGSNSSGQFGNGAISNDAILSANRIPGFGMDM